MTPTNEQELKELAELREYVKELEGALLRIHSHWDGYGDRCRLCGENSCRNIDGKIHHTPDCIVTNIRNRRGL